MKDRLLAIVLPLTAVALLLLAWDRAVVWLQVPTYLLPRPADVGTAFWAGYVTERTYWKHLVTTLYEVVVGYGIGCTIALIAGAGSGIVKGDLKSLKGKKIAAKRGGNEAKEEIIIAKTNEDVLLELFLL